MQINTLLGTQIFGTLIWDPDMDPDLGPRHGLRFGTPIWDPDLGP
jgi:hypothetical protein